MSSTLFSDSSVISHFATSVLGIEHLSSNIISVVKVTGTYSILDLCISLRNYTSVKQLFQENIKNKIWQKEHYLYILTHNDCKLFNRITHEFIFTRRAIL